MLSLVHRVAGRPWAIQAEIALHIRGIVAKDGIGGLRHLAELKGAIHAEHLETRKAATPYLVGPSGPMAAAGPGRRSGGVVAVIPVIGTLTQRAEAIGSEDFTRSTADLADQVTSAVAEPKVDAVVLEFDSPGGEVFGVPEAWTAIRAAAKLKPIVAHANSVAASAAYYLFCACTEGWVTPSGQVGSVGVYALHVDASKALEDLGEKWTFISAGKFKVEGNPAEPLSEEARAAFQADVDRYYQMFTRDVAKGRGVSLKRVEGGFGEGRMVGAGRAVEEKMADREGTLEQAIQRASQLARDGAGGRPAASASVFQGGTAMTVDEANEERAEQGLPPLTGETYEPAPTAKAPEGPTAEQREALARLRAL